MKSIAIDGPAGSGKSTIAKAIADRLKITHLDTGAMYRVLALHAKENRVSMDDENKLGALLSSLHFSLENGQLLVNGRELPSVIRDNEIGMLASKMSAIPMVRMAMQEKQRELAETYSLILDGRDIGTYVLPNTPYKIYLDADVETRAKRRWEQQPDAEPYDKVLSDLIERDRMDREREIAPLKVADDAYVLDNTDLDVSQTVDTIINILEEIGWS